ncbi:hypothetical protein RB2654_21253 [Rhodobacterales bacterium HTCC2654]|uniref:Uncharacterized protein n=2 Tax=Maritimibacter TaxID=404235 RepID=A3VKJ8_9RHOB|nr:hypothetical protein RB2654_21253 [Rhodobacterales bacterium HTCC2654] [Maritimibacter alkaliphilus HTCC2654]
MMRFTRIALVFLAGYATNDLLGDLIPEVAPPALALSDFDEVVQEIIEDCEVYVYDFDGSAGYGEIDC